MNLSDKGLQLIKTSEGFSASVYKDVAGVPTVGYGHKLLPGESFPNGIDEEQATGILMEDVKTAEDAVTRLAPADITQGQFDALVDFTFNLGQGNLHTMLSHGWAEVTAQIPLWCHAGGKEVPVLVTRRAAEIELFNS